MKKEITVQAKGLNKKFLFLIIMFVAIGLVAALVLLLPASVKAQKEEEQPVEVGGDKYLYELDYEQTSVAYDEEIKIDAKREKTYRELIERHLASKEIDKAKEILKQAKEELGGDACSEMESKISAAEALAEETARLKKIFDYRVEGNQTVTITGLHNKESVEVVIPETIEGYQVGKIGVMAFDGCRALKRIELPEGLIEIESGVFQCCTQFERLVIPSSVTKIAEGFAPLCDSLKEIKVEEGNRFYTSKDGVLFTKDIKTLVCVPGGYTGWKYTISDGITRVGSSALNGCKIEVVVIPESVSVIGEHAFWNCHKLKEITIPKNVSEIGVSIVSSHIKVNIDTDIRLAMTAEMRRYIVENTTDFDPRKPLGAARKAIMEMVQHKMRNVLNSSNQL